MKFLLWICKIVILCSFFAPVKGETEKFVDKFVSSIPKLFHRLHVDVDPKNSEITEKNRLADASLKSLHPDWTFLEWTSQKILNFLVKNYENPLSLAYLQIDNPLEQEDFALIIIIYHFGGVFLRNNVYMNRSIDHLLGEADLVLSNKFEEETKKDILNNNFIAAVPQHNFLEMAMLNLTMLRSKNYVQDSNHLSYLFAEYMRHSKTHDPSIIVLLNKYLVPFHEIDKLPSHLKGKCLQTESLSQCFGSFASSYGYELWDLSSNLKFIRLPKVDITKVTNTTFSYDKLFIMNIKRSPERWAHLAKEMFDHDMRFERFEGVDGYAVKIKDSETGQVHQGIDIKRKIYSYGFNHSHEIACVGRHNSRTFLLKAGAHAIIAGVIGVWCSKVLLLDYVLTNKWKNTVVFEDDFHPNWDNFQENVNKFINALPANYDLGFLDSPLTQIPEYRKNFSRINDFVVYMPPDSQFYGDWAYTVSSRGASQLNLGYEFFGNPDEYIRYLSRGKIRPNVELNVYVSAQNLSVKPFFGYNGRSGVSLTTLMGCRPYQPSLKSDCDNRIHVEQVYILVNNDTIDENLQSQINAFKTNRDTKSIRLVSISESRNLQIIDNHMHSFRNKNDGAIIQMKDLRLHRHYSIICNPHDIHVFKFSMTVHHVDTTLEELQRWCSLYRVWRDARSNSFSNILVVDQGLSPVENFHSLLNTISTKLPKHYDITLLNHPKEKIENPMEGEIFPLSPDTVYSFGSARAVLFSHKAIRSLTSHASSSPSSQSLMTSFFACMRDPMEIKSRLRKSDVKSICKIAQDMQVFAVQNPLF